MRLAAKFAFSISCLSSYNWSEARAFAGILTTSAAVYAPAMSLSLRPTLDLSYKLNISERAFALYSLLCGPNARQIAPSSDNAIS